MIWLVALVLPISAYVACWAMAARFVVRFLVHKAGERAMEYAEISDGDDYGTFTRRSKVARDGLVVRGLDWDGHPRSLTTQPTDLVFGTVFGLLWPIWFIPALAALHKPTPSEAQLLRDRARNKIALEQAEAEVEKFRKQDADRLSQEIASMSGRFKRGKSA